MNAEREIGKMISIYHANSSLGRNYAPLLFVFVFIPLLRIGFDVICDKPKFIVPTNHMFVIIALPNSISGVFGHSCFKPAYDSSYGRGAYLRPEMVLTDTIVYTI